MDSIEAMEIEIRYQIDDLPNLILPGQTNLHNCVIVGAGDSYVAGLIAQYASNHIAICCNPMEIVLNPAILRNRRRIYIVSISGNTKSNILAAKISKKQNVPAIAITSKSESKLGRICDEIIELRYKSTGILTSGTISFTSSMLTCLSLVSKANNLDKLRSIYRQTNDEAESLIDPNLEKLPSCIFIGEGILFPIAIYGALKISEVFGSKSYAYSFEEFCHSPIFSAKRNDKIIILGAEQYGGTSGSRCNSKELNERLIKLSFSSAYIDCSELSLPEILLKSVMFLQLYVVKQALKHGIKNCFFLQDKNLLNLSSSFIYDDM